MNEFGGGYRDSDVRSLVSHAVPTADEEPPVRDVVGPAMAWGERRRRLDRVTVATGTAALVLAVAGAVAAIGDGPSPEDAAAGGRSPLACTLPFGQPASPQLCALQTEVEGFPAAFTRGVAPVIEKLLPAGVQLTKVGPDYLRLTKGQTTEYLYPQLLERSTLTKATDIEVCDNPNCVIVTVLNGKAALGSYGSAVSADWVADAPNTGPRLVLVLATESPQEIAGGALPNPNGVPGIPEYSPQMDPRHFPAATLMTATQLADVIARADFQQYASITYAQQSAVRQQYLNLMASELPSTPGGYISGSIPRGGLLPGSGSDAGPGPTSGSPAATSPGSFPSGYLTWSPPPGSVPSGFIPPTVALPTSPPSWFSPASPTGTASSS